MTVTYKGVVVGKGTQLEAAMVNAAKHPNDTDAAKAVKLVYENTSRVFEALYGPENAKWFYSTSRDFANRAKS